MKAAENFDNYLAYGLRGEICHEPGFAFDMPLRYVSLVQRIAELLDTNFRIAMEVSEDLSCCNLYLISSIEKDNSPLVLFLVEKPGTPFRQVRQGTRK